MADNVGCAVPFAVLAEKDGEIDGVAGSFFEQRAPFFSGISTAESSERSIMLERLAATAYFCLIFLCVMLDAE